MMPNKMLRKLTTLLPKDRKSQLILVLVIFTGVLIRFYVSQHGQNFDIQSYKIVAYYTDHGQNVYASTPRYNYGPIWFNILHVFSWVAHHFHHYFLVFRLQIVTLLTLADVAITIFLLKRFGLPAASFFFLNPVTVAITGYGNQFECLAILTVFIAVIFLGKAEKNPKATKELLLGSLLLGLSLVIKHLFIFLPFWLMLRMKGRTNKLIVFSVPILLFVAAFLPYLGNGGLQGILHNALFYKSHHNAPFFQYIVPKFLQQITGPNFYFGISLLIGALATRKIDLLRSILWYTLVLVIFSPAIANQYLAIVMPALAVLASWLFVPYVVLATVLLWSTNHDSIHSLRLYHITPQWLRTMVEVPGDPHKDYLWIITLLFLGAAFYIFRDSLKKSLKPSVKAASDFVKAQVSKS